MTMREASGKPWRDIRFAYLGDARNNMGHSLLMAGAKMGMDVRISAPKSCLPRREVVDLALETAKTSGAKVTVTEDPLEAVKGCDFLHTDVWVSMGEPVDVWNERIRALLPYQVNAGLVAAAENPEVRFMHCLPAFHNVETKVARAIVERHPNLVDGLEVTEEVFESPRSIVFEQAENRMHTIKALLVATLA